MQSVEDARRLKRRYNYDRRHLWKDPASLWLCPKAGGFQRRPSKGILQGIQSVGQLVIDDYAGFATSDGVLTLVPTFADASGHSSPGYLRMTIMARALVMERTHGFDQPDTYACWRDFKTQVVECLTSEAAMGIHHFSRKGLHLPAPELANFRNFPLMTHKLKLLNTGGFAQGNMAIPPRGSDAERHGLFAIDMTKLLTSIRDTELGAFSHHQSLLNSNLSTISSKINETTRIQTAVKNTGSQKKLYLRIVYVTLTEDYCCHSGVIVAKRGARLPCLAIVNVNSDMHGILPLTSDDEQNLPKDWSSPMEWDDTVPGPIKRLISPVPVIHHYCIPSHLQSKGNVFYGIWTPDKTSDEDWVYNCQRIVPNYNGHRTLLVPWAPMSPLVLQHFRSLASQAAEQARVHLIDKTKTVSLHGTYVARFCTNSLQSHCFLSWEPFFLPIANLLKAHTILCPNGQQPSPMYCHAFKSFKHYRDLHTVLVAMGIHVDDKVPKEAAHQRGHRSSTVITAPPPPSHVPSTVDMFG